VLKKWLIEHVEHPYLKNNDKAMLAMQSGLSKQQVQNWFTNIRKVRPLTYLSAHLAAFNEQVPQQEEYQETYSETQVEA